MRRACIAGGQRTYDGYVEMRIALPAWCARPVTGVCVAAASLAALTAATVTVLGVRGQGSILDAALLYLVATLLVAVGWGYLIGVSTAIAAALLVNFFFVPPRYTFDVHSPSDIGALAVFMAVAVIGSAMLSLVRRQYLHAEARRLESEVLLNLARAMARAGNPSTALDQLCATIARSFGAQGCCVMAARSGWAVEAASGDASLSRDDQAIAAEACRSGTIVRTGPARLHPPRHGREDVSVFVPLGGPEAAVLRLKQGRDGPPFVPAPRLLTAIAAEAGIALERVRLAAAATRVGALEQSDEMKSALLASLSHDLRSPLTSIKASVGSLRDPRLSWPAADVGSFLEEIEEQTDRLTRTVNNLLTLNRLEAGVIHANIEHVEVSALLEEVLANCRADVVGRPVSLDVEDGLWVAADYGLAAQAIGNLVQNAGRHSVPAGQVRLAAVRMGPRVAIRVSDDGPGIAAADLPFAFERGNGARPGTAGTGLGLAIVRAMVQLCGGVVSVHTRPGECVFTVALPAIGPSRR